MILKGKTAVVTGAGRGIGRGIALELARNGAAVVVNDFNVSLSGDREGGSPAADVVQEIRAGGGRAVAHAGSVTVAADAAEMVQLAVSEFGGLDILVHVAGILRDRMIFNMADDEWDAVIDVHLTGAFNTFRAASRHFRASRNGGRLIAMSSDSAFGAASQPNYAAAKAGILGLTWSTAAAMSKYGVTTNAVMPNGATRMVDAMSGHEGPKPSETASGTLSDPANVAGLVGFLASDAAAEVNGQIFYSQGYSYARLRQPTIQTIVSGDKAWTTESLAAVAGDTLLKALEPPFHGRMTSFITERAETEWTSPAPGVRSWSGEQ